jgi:hypothetical protein
MSEKEPGQLTQSTYHKAINFVGLPWELMCDEDKARWAAAESAIRADEAAKVWEKAAKVLETMIDKEASDLGDRADMALLDAAAALRAKIGAGHE